MAEKYIPLIFLLVLIAALTNPSTAGVTLVNANSRNVLWKSIKNIINDDNDAKEADAHDPLSDSNGLEEPKRSPMVRRQVTQTGGKGIMRDC